MPNLYNFQTKIQSICQIDTQHNRNFDWIPLRLISDELESSGQRNIFLHKNMQIIQSSNEVCVY